MFYCHLGKSEGFTTEFFTPRSGSCLLGLSGLQGSDKHLEWLLFTLAWMCCWAGMGGALASILWKSMFFFPFRNNPASARSTCNSQSSLTASCFFSAEQSPRKRCCPCTDLGLRSHQSWLILVWRLQERRLRTIFSGLNFFSGSARWFSAISVNFLEVLNAVLRQSCLLNPCRSLLSV